MTGTPQPAYPSRSFLYVPGNRPGMLAKAADRGADALIVDLEDAVPPGEKEAARDHVAAWLDERRHPVPALWVRVNPEPDLAAHDVAKLVRPGLTGVYLPKVASPERVLALGDLVAAAERGHGIAVGRTRIAPLIETAQGLVAINAIAAAPRVSHLALGEADLAADLGMEPSPDGRELDPIRSSVVVTSAAAGLNPPVGPVWTALGDAAGLDASSRSLRRMGYRGRAAIHPDQVPIINAAFSPTEEQIDTARDTVARAEAAARTGEAVTIAADGSLIDAAVVRRARHILALADAAAQGSASP